MDQMAQAHRQDYADKARIDDLRRAITEFLADPPRRARRTTFYYLDRAALDLKDDAAAIVRTWD